MLQSRQTGLDIRRGPAGAFEPHEHPRVHDGERCECGDRDDEPPRRQPSDAKGGDGYRQRPSRDHQAQVAELQMPRVERGDARSMFGQAAGVARGYGRTIPSAVHR